MNDKLTIIIILLLSIIFGVFVFVVGTNVSKNINENQKSICDNIGSKLDLDTYYSGKGNCGWGEACSFQCKFIDGEGGIVIKNIP